MSETVKCIIASILILILYGIVGHFDHEEAINKQNSITLNYGE